MAERRLGCRLGCNRGHPAGAASRPCLRCGDCLHDGTGLAAAFAALVKFAVLPQVVTYFGFSIILGLYLVPTGALIAQPRHPALFTAMAANFVPLLAPTNEMNYNIDSSTIARSLSSQA